MRALRLVLLYVLATGTGAARADTCPDPALAPLVTELTGWIAGHSTLDTTTLAANPPEIVPCHIADHLNYEGSEIIVEADLRAAYDAKARRIYLVQPWDADDPRDRATLLHELVHVAQFDSLTLPCPQAAEWRAYTLQHDWLAEQGIASGIDWPEVFRRLICPSDTHP